MPEIRVFADLLGILHAVCLVQRVSLSACSESLIDDKQMCSQPNYEISSSEYEGRRASSL